MKIHSGNVHDTHTQHMAHIWLTSAIYAAHQKQMVCNTYINVVKCKFSTLLNSEVCTI
jgi:hypothetical protein